MSERSRDCAFGRIDRYNAVPPIARRRGMTEDERDGRLKECLTTVRTLEEENRQLRQSADSFGQLAERLNQELARERRSVDADRRREPRDSPDRRSPSQQP